MRTFLRPILVVLVLVFILTGLLLYTKSRLSATSGSHASPPGSLSLEKMLTDRRLWGDDALAVFASLNRWKSAGETSLIIFPDKVGGGTKFETSETAQRSLAAMTATLKQARPTLRPEFASEYRQPLAKRGSAFRVEVARFLEDDSFRVVWQREGGEFLKRDVKMKTILETYGKPEQTTTEVVQSRADRRPAVLTVYHYADGAVRFAESDLAPIPGVVDRVILDVGAVAPRIFLNLR